MKLYCAIGLLLCFTSVLTDTPCGTFQCGSSDQCCNDSVNGPVCYNPTTSDCVGGTRLCGKGEGACGSTCYDTTAYTCAPDGHLLQGGTNTPLFCNAYSLTPCEAGQLCCSNECFDPNTYVCLNYQLCPVGHSVCGYGDQCYDVSTQECCNNEVAAKGTSVCSQSSATCCSCSCNSPFITEGYTVSGSEQCTNEYVTSNFGELECPGVAGGCGENCNVSCGSQPFIFNYCFSDVEYGCSGHYLCSGGPYTCSVTSSGACPFTVSDSSHSTTEYSSGSTQYQIVPADYQGEVCCWCASASGQTAISTPIPVVADCTPAFVAVNNSFVYADTECRVWSPFTPFTDSAPHVACGLPE